VEFMNFGEAKMLNLLNKLRKSRKGAALVEYGLLIAGVALISAAAVSIFGHKTNDLIAATAAVLPGAHADDNEALVSGKLIETTEADDGPISLDVVAIVGNADTPRLGNNVLGVGTAGDGFGGLVVEANP
jgi:pilus assembly protein Flp/PilA